MATESDLRDLLQGPDPEGRTAIDLDAVLRRARARRRPRVIAASTVGAFALVGVLTPVILISQQQTAKQDAVMVAEDASGGSPEAPADGDTAFTTMPSAWTLTVCGGPVAEVPSGNDLVLEIAPVAAEAGNADIPIVVTLRNTGSTRISGVTGRYPAVTFASEGVVLWHTNGIHDQAGVLVDLAPGESLTYETTFEPVVCSADDEADPAGFPAGLPPAEHGSYAVSAAIDFIPDDGTTGPVVVTGPAAPVELR